MHLRSLYLQHFRPYKEAYFEFDSSLNLISGPNACGKTTLLEAIYYLMVGRSFRSSTHQDLMKVGSHSFFLEGIFSKYHIEQKLRIHIEGKERKIIYNSTALPSIANLLGLIQGVIMTPDDVLLVKGPPQLRRQFLDIQIAQVDPLYIHFLSRYAKAMRQRNQLLRQKQLLSIESWEHEMAQAAAYIVFKRGEAIEALRPYSRKFYSYLTEERETLELKYDSEAISCKTDQQIKEFYLTQFKKNRDKEMILGYTVSGPHKDDIWIGIGSQDIRYFASEGQQRSCVAALHMGEWEQLKEMSNDIPLLMIDDVGISLDDLRRKRLIEQLQSLGQVFLTTTDPTLIDPFRGSKKIIKLPFLLEN